MGEHQKRLDRIRCDHRRELAQLERKITSIVNAIADGGANPALQAKLDRLTAEVETQKRETPTAPPALSKLSVDLGTLYR
jgi:hypothetical protein